MTYRYKHIDLFIVLVVELNYEQEERGDTVSQTCYLYGSEGLFALLIRRDGQDSVRYCHRDHLGSVIGYSDELGHLIQELSYDAWGRRRDPGTWAYQPTLASVGGAAGAMVGAILNGQNFGQILKSTFQGALFGAMSGALNFSIGGVSNMVARLAAHSVADGLMEGVQGGNVLHGAMMGLLSAGSGEGMMALGGSLKTGMKVALQSVIGGTLSELGGGNFANGAITAAFSFLFNHTLHERKKIREITYRDESTGVIPAGRRGAPAGQYGVDYKITITEQGGAIDISVLGCAKYRDTPGPTSAAIVMTLTLDNLEITQTLEPQKNMGFTD